MLGIALRLIVIDPLTNKYILFINAFYNLIVNYLDKTYWVHINTFFTKV